MFVVTIIMLAPRPKTALRIYLFFQRFLLHILPRYRIHSRLPRPGLNDNSIVDISLRKYLRRVTVQTRGMPSASSPPSSHRPVPLQRQILHDTPRA